MQDALSPIEVTKIEQFCSDEAMFNAVKKVLFAILYSDGVVSADKPLNTQNGAFGVIAQIYSKGGSISNEELGQGLRAKFEGVHTILEGFEVLKTIKNEAKPVESPYNDAI